MRRPCLLRKEYAGNHGGAEPAHGVAARSRERRPAETGSPFRALPWRTIGREVHRKALAAVGQLGPARWAEERHPATSAGGSSRGFFRIHSGGCSGHQPPHRNGSARGRRVPRAHDTTRDGVAARYTPETKADAKVGGLVECTFGNYGSLRCSVDELVPNRRVKWTVGQGPPEWMGSRIIFELAHDGGATDFECSHAGPPDPYASFSMFNSLGGSTCAA